jgi:trypsin
MNGRPKWSVAILSAVIGLLLCSPVPAQPVAKETAEQSARKAFANALHKFARDKAGRGQPGYFAIVRRGLDWFDALAQRDGPLRASRSTEFAGIDPTPEAIDGHPEGQALTSVRLGIKPSDARIVGGFEVEPGQFDQVVALTGNGFLCSGIALDSMTVLTAAHCACDLKLSESSGIFDRHKLVHIGQAVGGNAKQHKIDVRNTKFLSAFLSQTVPCGNMAASLRNGNPDLAVVRVVPGEPMAIAAMTVAAPAAFNAALGKPFFIVGFGCSSPTQPDGRFVRCRSNSIGKKLMGIVLRSEECVLGPGVCVPGKREFILSNFGTEAKADTCAGDSGGPVVIVDSTGAQFRPLLVGITSRALNSNGNCGFGGIYGRVASEKVIEWLGKRSENLVE